MSPQGLRESGGAGRTRLRGLVVLAAVAGVLAVAGCGFDFTFSTAGGDDYLYSVREGDSARQAGEPYAAIAMYGRALQAYPEGTAAKQGLGETYLGMGASEEAAAQFREILARNSDDRAARRGLASALIAMNQPELAEQQLLDLLRSDPRDVRALNALGVTLDMQGRHDEAQIRYRQGIELAPDSIATRVNYGLSLAIAGQAAQAIDVLAPVVASRAADPRSRQNLAFAYAIDGQFEKALQLCRYDLPEGEAQKALSYFMQLRALSPQQRSVEVRSSPYFFPQTRHGG